MCLELGEHLADLMRQATYAGQGLQPTIADTYASGCDKGLLSKEVFAIKSGDGNIFGEHKRFCKTCRDIRPPCPPVLGVIIHKILWYNTLLLIETGMLVLSVKVLWSEVYMPARCVRKWRSMKRKWRMALLKTKCKSNSRRFRSY